MKNSSAKKVLPFSTVVALYGATAGQVSLITIESTTNQAVCALIPKDDFAYFNYLWMSGNSDELGNQAVGSAQQNISKRIVERTRILLPQSAVVIAFNRLIAPLFDRWISSLSEVVTLAELRDLLLPRMIAGRIRATSSEGLKEEWSNNEHAQVR